ncbi:hypothetical protein PR002_g26198 [Phytophthora rubi]|uniref:Uncharacterized protein n=1 Tax=Phytophthora rubi TaxID=129364 RepID=A0A6A3HVJ4_9STRA|nr:hypothetical protein PR002_g26198 [Phytophthora rubi]
MGCLSSERLRENNDTRVTVIEASQHGVFDSTRETLNDLTAGKRKAYIAQITVCYSQFKKGVPNRPNLIFHPGALYAFRQIDGVDFYADIPIGQNAKAKAKELTSSQDTDLDDEPEDDEPEDDGDDSGDDDVSMDSETKVTEEVVAACTRSNNPLVV